MKNVRKRNIMTLAELKKTVDAYCEGEYVNPDEVNVIITLEEMSIGPRAGTGIENIFLGFDWEHNQLRIQPKEKLVRYNKQRDIPKDILYYKLRDLHYCPTCQHPLKKTEVRNNKYCPFCGQCFTRQIKFVD